MQLGPNYVVVEITGGEPQIGFDTKEAAEAFIRRVRNGLNPYDRRPLSEHPYKYSADSLAITRGGREV